MDVYHPGTYRVRVITPDSVTPARYHIDGSHITETVNANQNLTRSFILGPNNVYAVANAGFERNEGVTVNITKSVFSPKDVATDSANLNRYFEILVWLEGVKSLSDSGRNYNGTLAITGVDGSVSYEGVQMTNPTTILIREGAGNAVLYLKHGQTAQISDLPAGASVYVKESEESGYYDTKEYVPWIHGDQNEYRVIAGENVEIAIQNRVVPVVEIMKVDEAGEPITGGANMSASFTLHKREGGYTYTLVEGGWGYGSSASNPKVFTTDPATGKVSLGRLRLRGGSPVGEYFLRETQAPEGYANNTYIYYYFSISETSGSNPVYRGFQFEKGGTNYEVYDSGKPNTYGIKIANSRLPSKDLSFTKVSSANNSVKLKDAEFELYRTATVTGSDVTYTDQYGTTQKSGLDGNVTFRNVPYGTYYLTEKTAPAGYERAGRGWVVEIDANSGRIYEMTVSGSTVSKGAAVAGNIIENDPTDVTLTLRKEVAGLSPEALALENPSFSFTVTITPIGGADRIESLQLYHGDSEQVTIPYGATVSITETTTDGYLVSFSEMLNGTPLTHSGASYTIAAMEENRDVTVTNTPGARLPETGGIGTKLYTFGGIALMGTALMYGFCFLRRKKRKVGYV